MERKATVYVLWLHELTSQNRCTLLTTVADFLAFAATLQGHREDLISVILGGAQDSEVLPVRDGLGKLAPLKSHIEAILHALANASTNIRTTSSQTNTLAHFIACVKVQIEQVAQCAASARHVQVYGCETCVPAMTPAVARADFDCLQKVSVESFSLAPLVCGGASSSFTPQADSPLAGGADSNIEFQTMVSLPAEGCLIHECLMRNLQDKWDPPQIELVLGALTMQCDLCESLMDPQEALTPELADAIELVTKAKSRGVKRVPSLFARGQGALAPSSLHISQLISADGVCESVLFGQPVLLRPSSSFMLSWDCLELEQHKLFAFSTWLANENMVALAAVGKTHLGWYLLMPAAAQVGAGLLVKKIAVRELLLPRPIGTVLPEVDKAVHDAIHAECRKMPLRDTFNPMLLTSHLFTTIREKLTGARHGDDKRK